MRSVGLWCLAMMAVACGDNDSLIVDSQVDAARSRGGSWRSISAVDAPQPRRYASAVWSGSQIFVWGGDDYALTKFSTGGRYDPATDTWHAISAIGAPTWDYADQLFACGTDLIAWTRSRGYRYNPVTDAWRAMSATGAPTWGLGGATCLGGAFYVFSVEIDGPGLARYDLSSDAWQWVATPGTVAAVGPGYYQLRAIGDELVVWGNARPGADFYRAGARYRPRTGEWTAMSQDHAPPVASPLDEPSTVIVFDDVLVVLSAIYDQTTGSHVFVTRYSPLADAWERSPDVPEFGYPSGGSGNLILWNGKAGEIIDVASQSWVRMAPSEPALSSRENFSTAWTGHDMFVWAGLDTGQPTNTGGMFTP